MIKTKSPSRDAFVSFRVLFGFVLSAVGVLLALVALSIYSSSTAAAQRAKQNGGFTVIPSYHNDVSPAGADP